MHVCVCVCVCDTCAVIIKKFFTLNLPEKCSVSLQSVPKEYLRSPITALPLFHCHYANVIAAKPTHTHTHGPVYSVVWLDAILIQFSPFSFIHVTYATISSFSFSSVWAKNVEFFSNEIHFAYHSKYLYSFVGNLEPFSLFCVEMCRLAKKAL